MKYQYRDTRDEIILSWFQRGERSLAENNIFEAYIYFWISWVVACKRFNNFNFQNDFAYENKDTDRDEVIRFCGKCYLEINKILKSHENSLEYLANRKGTRFHNPIVDVTGRLGKVFNDLSRDLKGEINLIERQRAEYVGELLNKIRNNLFHGDKIYNDGNDRNLIQNTVYILKDFTKLAVEMY
jgi:hypothetical protein